MKLDWDLGTGGVAGPWLQWHPHPSRDGSRPAQVWTLRDGTECVVCDALNAGIVLDIYNVQSGWERSSGVKGKAPDRQWSSACPGEGWKACFSVPIALTPTKRATWEQAGFSARAALDDLRRALTAEPTHHDDMLPVVRQIGVRTLPTRRGPASIPVLTVVRWIERPACLADVPLPTTEPDDDEDELEGEVEAPMTLSDLPDPFAKATEAATEPSAAPEVPIVAPETAPSPAAAVAAKRQARLREIKERRGRTAPPVTPPPPAESDGTEDGAASPWAG